MPSVTIMGKKSLFIKLNGLENKASLAICSKCLGRLTLSSSCSGFQCPWSICSVSAHATRT